MAKSLYQIQMDYNNAVRQANSLIEIANDLRRTANSGLRTVFLRYPEAGQEQMRKLM